MRNFKIQDRRVVKILILYTKGSKPLLLVLKRLTNAKEAPGQGDLPGGKVNPGESCDAGIIREAYEETGLALEKVYHATQHTWQDSEGLTVEEHLFYTVVDTLHIVINPREHETYTWLPFDELAPG